MALGSGKTMILIFRARHLVATARPDQPVLVLCFNRTLADRIDAAWCRRGVAWTNASRFEPFMAGVRPGGKLPAERSEPGQRGEAYFGSTGQLALERALDTGRVPGGQYMALLIDEAHDFEDAWLRIAQRPVHPQTNSLLVLYDDAQSIYQARSGASSTSPVSASRPGSDERFTH